MFVASTSYRMLLMAPPPVHCGGRVTSAAAAAAALRSGKLCDSCPARAVARNRKARRQKHHGERCSGSLAVTASGAETPSESWGRAPGQESGGESPEDESILALDIQWWWQICCLMLLLDVWKIPLSITEQLVYVFWVNILFCSICKGKSADLSPRKAGQLRQSLQEAVQMRHKYENITLEMLSIGDDLQSSRTLEVDYNCYY